MPQGARQRAVALLTLAVFLCGSPLKTRVAKVVIASSRRQFIGNAGSFWQPVFRVQRNTYSIGR